MQQLAVGTRIYNHGDMENIDHFGTITEVRVTPWGTDYQITPDADSADTEPYWVCDLSVSEIYVGTGLSRIVTEDAYNQWRQQQLELLQAASTSHSRPDEP